MSECVKYNFDLSESFESYSSEAYFGQTNPLSSVLDEYNGQLLELLSNKLSYKKIKDVLDKYGKAVAKVLNFNEVFIGLRDNISVKNAFSMSMYCNSDVRKVDPKTKQVSVNDEFLKTLSSMVETSNGYRFKDRSGKNGTIGLSIGLFDGSLTVREISAIVAHELGHCFECSVYDIIDASLIRVAHMIYVDGLRNTDILFDNQYGVFARKGDNDVVRNKEFEIKRISRKEIEDAHDTIVEAVGSSEKIANFFSFLSIPESLRNISVANALRSVSYYIKPSLRFRKKYKDMDRKAVMETPILVMYLASKGVTTATDEIRRGMTDQLKNRVKKFYRKLGKSERKSRLIFPFNFIVAMMIYLFDTFKGIVKNTWYITTFQFCRDRNFEKNTYVKKFEQFADVFAASYGYGQELSSALRKLGGAPKIFRRQPKGINWMYNIPGINLIQYFNEYMLFYKRRLFLSDHGPVDERMNMMYIYLKKELESVDPETKRQIENEMANIEKEYNDLVGGDDVRCFSYRVINKMIFNGKLGNESGKGYDVEAFKREVLGEYAKIKKS